MLFDIYASHRRRAGPGLAEVNHRLANQDRRIHQEVWEGEISHADAMRLHRDDHQIRREEHLMASKNSGDICGRRSVCSTNKRNWLADKSASNADIVSAAWCYRCGAVNSLKLSGFWNM
ncbi:hypothetical protein GCT13_27265 [Paraburkholderia sp. CNPSo 3157]|uniref:Uncharacterized protein n=1 Tax=Paraburkholderia franconis TaxID=2654983 RepID=A0A7X1NFA8_9BURK|nr:hypothetical protein [Paraburkholderia franconis]